MEGFLVKRKRMEAEIKLANYQVAADEYIEKGIFVIEDDIDRLRRKVADVLAEARGLGADVSDLTEKWMNIAHDVIEAKKILRQ